MTIRAQPPRVNSYRAEMWKYFAPLPGTYLVMSARPPRLAPDAMNRAPARVA